MNKENAIKLFQDKRIRVHWDVKQAPKVRSPQALSKGQGFGEWPT
jgi:hypothetical protein